MSLPNPDYLTDELYNWDASTFAAVMLADDAGASGSKRTIRWDNLDSYDRIMVHDLIMEYATHDGQTEATALSTGPVNAYQVINYEGSIVGGNNAGMIENEIYDALVIHNGVEVPISLTGAASADWTTVVASIGVALTAQAGATDASVAINNGNIEFTSFAAGNTETIEVINTNLFNRLNGYKQIDEKRAGITDLGDIFDLNFKNGYQTYASLIAGLREISNTTTHPSTNTNDIYFNHGTAVWTVIHTGVAV